MTHEVSELVSIDWNLKTAIVQKRILDEANNNAEISTEDITVRFANATDTEISGYAALSTDSERIEAIATLLGLV